MTAQVKQIALSSKAIIIAFNIYNNYRVKRRFKVGNAESDHGVAHIAMSLEESLRYIDRSYEIFLRWSGFSPETFTGKRIMEVGTGDNLGLALRFIAAGAASVVSLDKFYSRRDPEQQRNIYLAMRNRIKGEERKRFDEAVDLTHGIEFNTSKLRYIYGTGVEEADKLLGEASFDFIISKGALQDVYDIDSAFAGMDRLLVPGGLMLHTMDLSDQGMFSKNGFHPLTFLTIPDSVYRMMSVYSGKANRRLTDYYQQKMDELGYDSNFLVTRIVGEPKELLPHKEKIERGVDYDDAKLSLVQSIRPKLLPRYARMTDEELLVSGIYLIAKKHA
jgi:SAM-dependent methyltransferase